MKKIIISVLISAIITILAGIAFSAKTPNVNKYFKNEIDTGKVEIKVNKKKVNFIVPFDFSELYPDGATRKVLHKIFKYIKYFPSYDITIIGHTDNIPPKLPSTKKRYPDLNAYSKGRAENVKKLLVRFGLKTNKIKTEGKGDSVPVASNETEQGRAKNRRVEIVVDLGIAMIPNEALSETKKQADKTKSNIEVKNLNPDSKKKSENKEFTPPKDDKLKGTKK